MSMRGTQFGAGPTPFPPHPAIFQEHLTAQYQEIEALLADNQSLAATHLAIRQELDTARHEIQRMANFSESLRAEKDSQMREMYDKSVMLQVDLRGVEAMRAQILHVRADIKELTNVKKELTDQTQELEKLQAEIANADKRASVANAVPYPGYTVNYGNPEARYVGNSYPASYSMNQVQTGAEGIAQYRPGPAWGAYNMQQAQGHR
ncbi:hypothetical protein ACFE04_006382 [Oxalis oulophora]